MAVVDDRDKVLEGRDGFLFLVQDTNDLLAQHAGRRTFSHAGLEHWRELLEQRIERVAAAGGRYVFAVAPNTHSIYPEHLPADIESAARRPIHHLIDHLAATGSPAEVLYPDRLLLAHKPEHQLFLRVDTHWTDYGAFLVYKSLLAALDGTVAERTLTEHDLYYIERTITGDLGSKLDPPREEVIQLARVAHHVSHPVYDNCVEGTGSLIVTHCEVAPPTRCLLLGDSYSYVLLKFLSETFGRVVFAQRPSLTDELLECERPDVVMSVMAERFLTRVPSDADASTQRDLEEGKRAAGRVRRPQAPYGPGPDLATVEQVEAIRAQMLDSGSQRDATVVSLMAYATLRPGDLMALRWSGVASDHIELPAMEGAAAPRCVPLWPVISEDLAGWRVETGGGDEDAVFHDPTGSWGIRDWTEWRDESYTPVVTAFGLSRLRPWALHNTYAHLRLIEGATPADVTAETGVPTNDHATARAHAASTNDPAQRSGDARIRAARAALATAREQTGR